MAPEISRHVGYLGLLFLLLSSCRTIPPPPVWEWQRVETGLPRQAIIQTVAVHPHQPTHLWVGYYATGGLAVSQDGGQTWLTDFNEASAGPILADNPVFDLLPVTTNGQVYLYAATRDGLLISDDAGATWRYLTVGLPPATAFALAHDTTGRVYVGLDEAGIYRQTPASDDWQPVANPAALASAAILSLAVSPDGQYLVAGTAGQGLWATQDGGQSWQATYPGEFSPAVALNPANPRLMVASLRTRLVRSQDGGQSWHTLPVSWASEELFSLLWLENGLVGAGSGRGQLYRSSDGGDSWVAGGEGLPVGAVLDLTVSSDGQLLAGCWTGVYGSDDGGLTWRYLSADVGVPHARTLLGTENDLLLGTGSGLYRWQADRQSWQVIPADFPSGGVMSLAQAASNPQILYGGTAGNGLYRSDDQGQTWRRLPSKGFGVPAVAVNPVDPAQVYLLAAWERPYESRDGGQTWRDRWQGFSVTTETVTIAFEPTNPEILYVGAELGLYRSRDGGPWQAVATELADQSVLSLLAQGSKLYIGATRGLYLSLDQGDSVDLAWGQDLAGISVTALLADPTNARQLYAGTAYAGVYQSLDEGQTWQPISPAALAEEEINDLAIGPAGGLFVATRAGVWHARPQMNGIKQSE